jgi:plasmid stabilization system protein ParE
MRIKITTSAAHDFEELRQYLAGRSYIGLQSVLADIEETIRSIPDNLLLGRATPRDDVRERITPKYRYQIPYYVRGDIVYILRVYHPKRAPLDYDSL